ncbi:MAG TPA: hypothetical protein VM347_28710, partial [Nonomuraea sp.]|nr:hypothetical protein [Nonomuraea sp.]
MSASAQRMRVWATRAPGQLPAMRQRTGLMAAGGGVLAATLLIAGLDNNAAGQPLAGTCVTSDLAPIPCAEHEAVYQVLTTVQSGKSGCPSGDYFEEGSLCLGYNVAAGDCIQDDPAGPIRV